MKFSDEDGPTPSGVAVIMAVAVVAGLTFVLLLANAGCHSKWGAAGLESSWGPLQGCIVHAQDGWVPEDVYRDIVVSPRRQTQ